MMVTINTGHVRIFWLPAREAAQYCNYNEVYLCLQREKSKRRKNGSPE